MPPHEVLHDVVRESASPAGRKRIVLVGPGFRFLSGLTVYTCSLANALCEDHDVSVVLLDRLIPTRMYPGAARVGHDLSAMRYDRRVHLFGNLDWYWGHEMIRIARRLREDPPDVMVLQWWTAAAAHSYLALARIAARHGIPVVIEFHEVQDTGEAGVPLAAAYGRRALRRLVGAVTGVIFHNDHDAKLMASALGAAAFAHVAVEVAAHGPYDHLTRRELQQRPATGEPTRVLSFGLIRPYKGVEDLIAAFDTMSDEQAARFRLDVVGETWEGWTAPADAIAASRHRHRIRFTNRYVSDCEATEHFADADVLVLPYRRGSASGPLQIAMNNGIFVVLYAVGGLVEAVRDYPGAILVAPNDVDALRTALLSIPDRRQQRFADPHSWTPLATAIASLSDGVVCR